MTETRRKLTTIFSADVQDYSRLMEADEEGTLAVLNRYRNTMAALIASHGGRVVNTWGDGLIAEFPSVVEAVRAAVDTQNELAGYNAGTPAGRQMLFRIGINLGDVIEVGEDIYGDGVNIAARLQASAPPGGIVISHAVYDQVRNKVPVGFDFLGQLTVKNISEGVPSYSVRIGEAAGKSSEESGLGNAGPQPAPPARPAGDAVPIAFPAGIRMYAALGVAAVVVAAINLLGGGDTYWAKWPILVFATLAALKWARTQHRIDRWTTSLIIIALAISVINLYTWEGTFWAQWPLCGIVIAIAARWLFVRR